MHEPLSKRKRFAIVRADMLMKMRRKRLQRYVEKYFKKYPEIKLVTVTGSIGKTQAKIAAATVLSERFRVRLFHGNRGTNFTTPLSILGIDYPGDIKGFRAWHRVFRAARQRIRQPQDVDVIIQELNATKIGSLASYANYIVPDISIITAISESNLEVFGSIDHVAQEQLSIGTISRSLLINRDDIDSRFAAYLTNPNMNTYGLDGVAEFRFEESDYSIEKGYSGSLIVPGWQETIPVVVAVHDNFMLRQVVAAATVGVKLGMQPKEVAAGIAKVRPLNGHMNTLRGVDNSMILDDSANTSPLGARTALQSLYQISAPQKIAVMGSMKRLGTLSQTAHQEVGRLCDPLQLAWVVTVGAEANQWLAPAARGRGCQVKECSNALEAGAFVKSALEDGGVTLFNGHEDDTYLEESIKVLLHSTKDEAQLVRQSPEHMRQKFEDFSFFKS